MLELLIIQAQQGNKTSMDELLYNFRPLIKKYAFRLHTEDGESELQLFFIELIHQLQPALLIPNNDGKIINYISTSIENHYKQLVSNKIRLSNSIPFSAFSEEQQVSMLQTLRSENDYSHSLLSIIQNTLTANEYDVIIFRYYLQFSLKEIADMKNISRQAVSQMHHRALKKLINVLT